jgi:hypothetical protein
MVSFYEDNHTMVKVERRQVAVKVENKTFIFGPHDPLDILPEGTEVILHHAPVNPEFVLVTCKGQFVGQWPRQLARRNNADSVAAGIQRKQSFLNHAASQVRGKMLDKLVEQDRRLNENIEVLTDAGVLPSESDYALSEHVPGPGNELAEKLSAARAAARSQPERDADLAAQAEAALARRNDEFSATSTPAIEDHDDSY